MDENTNLYKVIVNLIQENTHSKVIDKTDYEKLLSDSKELAKLKQSSQTKCTCHNLRKVFDDNQKVMESLMERMVENGIMTDEIKRLLPGCQKESDYDKMQTLMKELQPLTGDAGACSPLMGLDKLIYLHKPYLSTQYKGGE